MTTTTKGISYPTSSDNIAPLESHFAALAATADRAAALTGSEGFTGHASTGSAVNVAVTFGVILAAVPKVVCTIEGSGSSSSYIATVVGPTTTTGFTAKVYRLDGSGADTSLKLIWFASDYAA